MSARPRPGWRARAAAGSQNSGTSTGKPTLRRNQPCGVCGGPSHDGRCCTRKTVDALECSAVIASDGIGSLASYWRAILDDLITDSQARGYRITWVPIDVLRRMQASWSDVALDADARAEVEADLAGTRR